MKFTAYILSFCFVVMSVSSFALQVHNHKETQQDNCCKKEVVDSCHKPSSKKSSSKKDNCCENDCLCVLNYAPISVLNTSFTISKDDNTEKLVFFTITEATIKVTSSLFRPPKSV